MPNSLIVGFGSTYGHLYSAMEELRRRGHKVAIAQFEFINPLPKNTAKVLTLQESGCGRAKLGPVCLLSAPQCG